MLIAPEIQASTATASRSDREAPYERLAADADGHPEGADA